jgi:hypothetical protein
VKEREGSASRAAIDPRTKEHDVSVQTIDARSGRIPIWLWGVGSFGVAWNLYGLYQFAAGFTPAGRAATTAGMTSALAELYLSLPGWISVVFAIGVFGGLIGSATLLLRRRMALPILAASLIGYILLFTGDVATGVFAAIPSQLAILTVVVLIAASLFTVAWLADRRGLLR